MARECGARGLERQGRWGWGAWAAGSAAVSCDWGGLVLRSKPAASAPGQALRCKLFERIDVYTLKKLAAPVQNQYDTDGATPGTQPPAPLDEPEKKAQPGRLVARLERAVEDLDVWQAEWLAADTEKLRGHQRERFKKALADLKAKVAAMEGVLG